MLSLQYIKIVSLHGIMIYFMIALLLKQCMVEILRIKCETYANFSVVQENKRLHYAFRRLLETDRSTCKYECAMEPRCKSINVNDGENICELNEKSADDPKDNIGTNIENGWTYFSPRYNETLVGINCQQQNYCGENQKCMDICECPGYRCIDKYKIMTNERLNWTDARARCRGLGGDLASIVNADEDNTINQLLPEIDAWFWIGYNDLEEEGTFKWSDGMPATYKNWGHNEAFGPGKEGEDCAMLITMKVHPNFHWYDAPCRWENNFVCKFY